LFNIRKITLPAIVALSAVVGASPAAATPAQFSSTVNQAVKPVGSVSISWGVPGMPLQTRQCTSGNPGAANLSNAGGQGAMTVFVWNPTCTDSNGTMHTMRWMIKSPLLAQNTGGAFSLNSAGYMDIRDTDGAPRIWGPSSTLPAFSLAWTNGTTAYNGANPSTFTFSNTVVMYANDSWTGPNQALRVTGTFQLGLPGPGPLLLS
jgi:hypothetical protein